MVAIMKNSYQAFISSKSPEIPRSVVLDLTPGNIYSAFLRPAEPLMD
jgi:hypothetical protein